MTRQLVQSHRHRGQGNTGGMLPYSERTLWALLLNILKPSAAIFSCKNAIRSIYFLLYCLPRHEVASKPPAICPAGKFIQWFRALFPLETGPTLLIPWTAHIFAFPGQTASSGGCPSCGARGSLHTGTQALGFPCPGTVSQEPVRPSGGQGHGKSADEWRCSNINFPFHHNFIELCKDAHQHFCK